ncbi:MAG: leucyl aminopeptidase [Bdellovibrionales bacterium]|nr:leucyl aminopeptidase [Bdellovibrionales bacterium]
MRVVYHNIKDKKKNYDAFVLFVPKNNAEKFLKSQPQIIKQVLKEKLFKGEKNEVLFLPYHPVHHGKHLILAGLEDSKNHQAYRQASGRVYKILNQNKLKSAAVDLSSVSQSPEVIRAVTEGFLLSHYKYDSLKQKQEKTSQVSEILLLTTSKANTVLQEATVLAEATNFARYLGDTPSNLMTPSILTDEIRKQARGTTLQVSTWNKEKIKKEKMGGLLGVSLGSSQEPRFIAMEYKGAKPSAKPICFVGKGVTFDSGGISIKPSPGMDEMKFDMCGSAAVAGVMLAISRMKLKINVIAFISATENMPGASANKPGDVLTARNGKTMEVLNTDAEGRLILADALSYASEKKPEVIYDAATLTGAMVMALGNSHTGFFTRNSSLRKRIEESAKKSGESVWAMPLVDDHVEDIKSNVADVANISSFRGAGSATAAAFLEHFVDKNIPWAHFDIAGTAWSVSNRLSYCRPKGASGVMVRTFYELACSHLKK